MGEALCRKAFGDQINVYSAGVKPGPRVDPLALVALKEIGIDHSNSRNKSSKEAEALFEGKRPDLVITVCDNAASEPCPIYTKTHKLVHHSFRDPPRIAKEAGAETDETALPYYREVMKEIDDYIRSDVAKLLATKGISLVETNVANLLPSHDTSQQILATPCRSLEVVTEAVSPATTSSSSSSSSPISFFDKYLTVWVGLSMIIGALIGYYSPDTAHGLAKADFAGVNAIIAVLLWIILIPMFVTLEFRSISRVAEAPQAIILTTSLNYLVKPFSMLGLAILFLKVIYAPLNIDKDLRDSYIAGLILLAGAPCTAMVFVWSNITGGDTAYTLMQVAVNDLLMLALYIPICGWLIGASDIKLPWDTVGISVALFVAAPLALALVIRYTTLRYKSEQFLSDAVAKVKPSTPVALLLMVVVIFIFQGKSFGLKTRDIFLLAVPIAIQSTLLFGICWAACYYMGIEHFKTAPASMIATSNFFELAVAVAMSVYGPDSGATLATVVGVLVEVPIMLAFCYVCNYWKPMLDARVASVLQGKLKKKIEIEERSSSIENSV
jgi:arsenite transporter